MKLVELDVRKHKKTERLIRTLERSASQIVSVKDTDTMIRVVITKDLFIENQYMIEQMNGRVRAKVYWIDTESMDRRYARDIRNGEHSPEKLARDYIKRIRKFPKSDYHTLAEKGSPGGRFSTWQDVVYAVCRTNRVDMNGEEAND